MSSWPSSDACGASVTLTAPEVQAGQTLFGSSSGYSVLEFIGEGCFGKVAKCQTLATRETVAVKILKKNTDFTHDTEKEVSMLEAISVLNPDHTNVVKFFERFEHMGQTCLVFEMLKRSLYELLQERDWIPLSSNEIWPIAKQLLVALDALKGLGILHTVVKADNIMFANTQDQPLRVKLIDFGKAIPAIPAAEFKDRRAFIDLMKQLLHLDGDLRISPHQALQHPFITMSHLTSMYSYDEGPAAWSSNGLLPSLSYDEDSATWSSDGELSSLSCDEDSAAWSFDEISSLSSDEDPAAWSFEEITSLSCDEDSAAWSSDGELSSLSCGEDPASWSSDGAQAKTSREDAPALGSCDGGLPSCSYIEDPASWSSDGAKPTDFIAAASASSGRTKKLKKRIRRFFRSITATFFCCCRPAVED